MDRINRRTVVAGLAASTLAGCAQSSGTPSLQPPERTHITNDLTKYDAFERARRYADTPFGKIAYVETGTGAPALFLHGLGLNSYYWSRVLPRLAGERRCIAVDLMAHGYTEIGADQDVTFTAQAGMVLALMDALELGSVDLVGSDSGGAIAQIVAAKAPERVTSLVLTNCDVQDNWPPAALEAIRATAPDGALADNFAAIFADPALMRADGGLASMVFERPDLISDEITRIFLGPLTRTPERRAAFNRYVAPQDPNQLTRIEADLRALQAPCLILWASDDIFFGVEWAYWLQDALPNARDVVVFDGAKLFFPFERPGEVSDHIRTFWSSI